jgi:mevalonate kinase
MLLGEYAVLHGKHALVCAVDKRMTVTLTPRTDTKITLSSVALGHHVTDVAHLEVVPPFLFVLSTLKKFQRLLPSGCDISITSEFCHQIGFGSSAAVTVATLAAITTWLNQSLSEQDMVKEARHIIRDVQGLGSGADAAACVLGGIVAYKMQPLLAEKLPHQHALTAVYAGYKTPTVEAVKQVNVLVEQHPKVYQHLFHAIDACVVEGIQAVRDQNWAVLGNIMNIQQGLMESLGVNTPLLSELIQQLRAEKTTLGAKISGSGLGDCVVGLGDVAPLTFASDKIRQIPITISTQGVRCEKI